MYVSTVGCFLVTFLYCCCWTETVVVQKKKLRMRQQSGVSSNRENLSLVVFTTAAAAAAAADAGEESSMHGSVNMTTPPVVRQTRPFQILHPRLPDIPIECVALRSKRYISDGFCTSVKPVSDVVCTGSCLPIRDLPWYAEFIKVWSRQKTLQYRCVDDLVRLRKVTFLCRNGETRTYDIRVVRSCKCKRYIRSQNDSSMPKKSKKKKKKN